MSQPFVFRPFCAANTCFVVCFLAQPYTVYRDILSRAEPTPVPTAAAGIPGPLPASITTGGGEQHPAARVKVYNTVCSTVVPDYILSRYLHRILPAPDQLWSVQHALASQLALSSALAYWFGVGDRTPAKIIFSKQSGRVVITDFYPSTFLPLSQRLFGFLLWRLMCAVIRVQLSIRTPISSRPVKLCRSVSHAI
jgi:hypothetical protein